LVRFRVERGDAELTVILIEWRPQRDSNPRYRRESFLTWTLAVISEPNNGLI